MGDRVFNLGLKMMNNDLRMKSNTGITIYIILLLFIVTGCDNTLFNSGDISRLDTPVEEFTEVYINDIFEVYLYQDTVCKLSIEGGSNLLPNIEYKVVDGKLSVSDNNSAQWSRNYDKMKLHISSKKLLYMDIHESSSIQCIDTLITPQLKVFSITDYSDISLLIQCDNFYFVNEGTSGAYLEIKGTAKNVGMWARASAIIKADEFISENMTFETESIGNSYIHVKNKLVVEILNSGKVYYKGNPETIEYLNEGAKSKLIKID
ncbi:MAG: hypothetical protein A2X13_00110 [Bacteroidetes bacterium GWC2_33_15]|nr:MAG: hypothetical protein A2X10_03920 [Bacteroidetes bacterium GWA2_33_15]OFX51029.1 MAG: hypothetical protein A2X13_00110 [Bacteroidetes bacterium GWC2_33_15]OFX65652.1 MAG: hypothetical protein A2X15_13730 [Bacteroidetes bacterium GWB2_32_14]OFX70237.1 MAG: hypothetical protein A2X14_03000 [Bacteroidetes bacterium GWD2_33_33]HAN17233.1 hypothetical protein [Bacteroidales bacterium]